MQEHFVVTVRPVSHPDCVFFITVFSCEFGRNFFFILEERFYDVKKSPPGACVVCRTLAARIMSETRIFYFSALVETKAFLVRMMGGVYICDGCV